MSDLSAQRRFFAEEVQIASNVRTPALVEALATVPRERFLPAGPWTIRSDADFGAGPRTTPDADPRHVYHNIAIGIDPARMLFNGAPGLLAKAIDALSLRPGDRVLHVGTGTGYFTGLMAHCVGSSGRVVGIEVDAGLAARAQENLAAMRWVDVRHGDASGTFDEKFTAILINAGVTHPLDSWLDALAPGGRLVLPLTATMPAMGNIGKGLMVLVNRNETETFSARPLAFVAIYSAIGLRDEAINAELGKALQKQPFPPLKTLRRDVHERDETCWLHGLHFCLK